MATSDNASKSVRSSRPHFVGRALPPPIVSGRYLVGSGIQTLRRGECSHVFMEVPIGIPFLDPRCMPKWHPIPSHPIPITHPIFESGLANASTRLTLESHPDSTKSSSSAVTSLFSQAASASTTTSWEARSHTMKSGPVYDSPVQLIVDEPEERPQKRLKQCRDATSPCFQERSISQPYNSLSQPSADQTLLQLSDTPMPHPSPLLFSAYTPPDESTPLSHTVKHYRSTHSSKRRKRDKTLPSAQSANTDLEEPESPAYPLSPDDGDQESFTDDVGRNTAHERALLLQDAVSRSRW